MGFTPVEVAALVKADIDLRVERGLSTYGVPLSTFNGRNAAQDAYDEVLDCAKYLKQLILERDVIRQALYELKALIVSEIGTREEVLDELDFIISRLTG